MNKLILDPLWKSKICFPMKGLIVIVKESRDLLKIDEEHGGLVIVFHDQLFEFNFNISNLVIWTKINHKFFYKFIIVVKPGEFLIWNICQAKLEVIECHAFQERQSIGDFVRVRLE